MEKIDLDAYQEPTVEIVFAGESKTVKLGDLNRKIRPLLAAMEKAAKADDPQAEYAAWDGVKEAFGFPGMSDGQAKEAVDRLTAFTAEQFARKNGSGQPQS